MMQAAQELQKRHQIVGDTIDAYEREITAIWMNQNVCVYVFFLKVVRDDKKCLTKMRQKFFSIKFRICKYINPNSPVSR